MFYGKAQRRAEVRVQVAIPPDESEDELGLSDEEYEGEADLGLADTEEEETGMYIQVTLCSSFSFELMME